MKIENNEIITITKYLYPNYDSFDYHDNGDQVVVNVIEVDDFTEFFFKYIIFKDPFKITVNDKKIPTSKSKRIKEMIKEMVG